MVDPRTEEHALVARIARGDRSALEQLYRRNSRWLTARLQSRCPDPDTVDIALQDTFLAVWRTAGKYRGEGDVGAWLWGIAVRRLIDQLRKNRPVPIAPDTIAGSASGGIGHQPFEGSGVVDVEEAVLGTGVHGDLGDALRQLHPDLVAVLVATAIDGLSTKEAAALLGIPRGTVKTRLMRARAQLQETLA